MQSGKKEGTYFGKTVGGRPRYAFKSALNFGVGVLHNICVHVNMMTIRFDHSLAGLKTHRSNCVHHKFELLPSAFYVQVPQPLEKLI